jgi:hypothetical protein
MIVFGAMLALDMTHIPRLVRVANATSGFSRLVESSGIRRPLFMHSDLIEALYVLWEEVRKAVRLRTEPEQYPGSLET